MSSNYTEVVTLPSNGLLNPEIPKAEVTLRCITVADQKFISGSNLSGDRMINALLNRCVEEPKEFNPSKLTSVDLFYLLAKLRILSYGSDYSFITRCPECGKKITVNLDLADLSVEYLDVDYEDNMYIKLPRTGDTVYTRLLTSEDEEEVEKDAKRLAKKFKDSGNFNFILKLVKCIRKIELTKPNKAGDKVLENPLDIQKYVEELTDLDATAISSTLDQNYGIQTVIEHVCPECKEEVELGIKFTSQFFRPRFNSANR